MNVVGGATDVSTYFVLRLSATGVEATTLDVTTFDLQYVRTGTAPVAKVDATALAATDSAHADNKAIEIDATDQPGLYRVDWPDAAFAAGVRQVILTVKCATCFTEHMAVEIDTPVDAQKLGGTAQTGNDVGADVNDILTDTGTDGVVVAAASKTGYSLTTAPPTVAEIQAEMEENGASVLDTLQDRLTDTRSTYLDYLFSIYFGLVSVVAQAQSGAAGTITLTAGASAVTDFYKGQVIVIYTGTGAGQARVVTAYNGSTKVASVSPNWATAPDATSWYVITTFGSAILPTTLSDNIDSIKAKTDNLPTDPADESAIEAAITAAHATTDGKIDAVDNYVDTEVGAVKAVTDKLDTAMELDGAVYRLTENALEQAPSGTGASAATIADAVWDEAQTDHVAAGSTGESLDGAGGGGADRENLVI